MILTVTILLVLMSLISLMRGVAKIHVIVCTGRQLQVKMYQYCVHNILLYHVDNYETTEDLELTLNGFIEVIKGTTEGETELFSIIENMGYNRNLKLDKVWFITNS